MKPSILLVLVLFVAASTISCESDDSCVKCCICNCSTASIKVTPTDSDCMSGSCNETCEVPCMLAGGSVVEVRSVTSQSVCDSY